MSGNNNEMKKSSKDLGVSGLISVGGDPTRKADYDSVAKSVEQSKQKETPLEKNSKGNGGSPTAELDVSVKGDKVVIRFNQPVTMITLEAEQAGAMGQAMMQTANMAINNRKILIVKP